MSKSLTVFVDMLLFIMANKLEDVIIYCDGACSGNPGPGGWGSIITYNNVTEELSGKANATTNNRMEMSATLASLNFVMQFKEFSQIKKIQILTDSVYVIRGITQWIFGWKKRGWKTAEGAEVSNQDLWQQLDQAILQMKKKNPDVKLAWDFVKGHAGIPGNERCDEIAVAESKNEYVDLFHGKSIEYIFDPYELPEIKPLPDMKTKSNEPKKPAWYISYVNGVLSRHETWKECENLVKGRAAKFKKVSSAEEEEQIKKSWGLS